MSLGGQYQLMMNYESLPVLSFEPDILFVPFHMQSQSVTAPRYWAIYVVWRFVLFGPSHECRWGIYG